MRKQEKNECIAVIGTLTQAMQAQSVLASSAIRSEVVKADSWRQGCAYAVRYPCINAGEVRLLLKQAGIRIRG